MPVELFFKVGKNREIEMVNGTVKMNDEKIARFIFEIINCFEF